VENPAGGLRFSTSCSVGEQNVENSTSRFAIFHVLQAPGVQTEDNPHSEPEFLQGVSAAIRRKKIHLRRPDFLRLVRLGEPTSHAAAPGPGPAGAQRGPRGVPAAASYIVRAMYWPLAGGFIAFILIALIMGWIMDTDRHGKTDRDQHH
jgi:hypothetical protein